MRELSDLQRNIERNKKIYTKKAVDKMMGIESNKLDMLMYLCEIRLMQEEKKEV